MEATAEKSGQAEQRAQKKAARRAAFIQEVAEAVYNLGVQRQNEIEAKRQAQEFATTEQKRLQAKCSDAELAATSPLEALYVLNHQRLALEYRWESRGMEFAEWRAKQALTWSIKLGILPHNTAHLPSTEQQFLAWAIWKTANPSQLTSEASPATAVQD